MADVTQVPADVGNFGSDNAKLRVVQVGESGIVAGDFLYIDSADSNKRKRSNSGTAAEAAVVEMALSTADDDGYLPVLVLEDDLTVDVGASLTDGVDYVVSANDGHIAPKADWGTGVYMTILGAGNSDGDLVCAVNATGITYP